MECDFGTQFAVWLSRCGNGDVKLVSTDGEKLSLRVVGKRVTVLANNTDGSFFIESAEDARVSDLNDFLLSGRRSFEQFLDRLAGVASKKAKKSLAESYGSLGESGGSLGSSMAGSFSDEERGPSAWNLGAGEKERLLLDVAESGIEELTVNEDLASIVWSVDPKEFIPGKEIFYVLCFSLTFVRF
jgi:hypothetical protein